MRTGEEGEEMEKMREEVREEVETTSQYWKEQTIFEAMSALADLGAKKCAREGHFFALPIEGSFGFPVYLRETAHSEVGIFENDPKISHPVYPLYIKLKDVPTLCRALLEVYADGDGEARRDD